MVRFISALVLVISAAACSLVDDNTAPPQTAAQDVARPSNDTAPTLTDEAATTVAKHKAEFIAHFNSAFADKSDWKASVTGADGGPVCQLEIRFGAIADAVGFMTGHDPSKPQWDEVNVTEVDAKRRLKEVATQYATELNRLLDIPTEKRKTMGACGSGEGSMELVDASYMMKEIMRALDSFGGDPTDIGTTPKKLRDRLLADYVARLSTLRQQVDATEGFWMHHLIGEAQQQWNFTDEQLQLTPKDIEAYRRG